MNQTTKPETRSGIVYIRVNVSSFNLNHFAVKNATLHLNFLFFSHEKSPKVL